MLQCRFITHHFLTHPCLVRAGIATLVFKPFFQHIGRKGVMICGGVSFVVGAALQAGAINMPMLIIGRIALGLGIGFANQVC